MKQYAIMRRKRKRNPDASENWLVQVHPGEHNQNEARRALKSYRINRKSNEYDCVILCQVVQSLRLENDKGGVAEVGKPEVHESEDAPAPAMQSVPQHPAPAKPVKGAKPVAKDLIADRFA